MTSLVPSSPPSARPQSSTSALIGEGSAGAAALHMMNLHAEPLSRALRKAVPFFSRRGVEVRPELAKVVPAQDLGDQLTAPGYVAPLVTAPGGTRAALGFDGDAIAFLLEGSLGGDGSMLPELSPTGLSVAQHAFIARLAQSVVACLSTTLSDQLGLSLEPLPRSSGDAAGGAFITLPLRLFDPGADDPTAPVGQVVLAISKHALLALRDHRQTARSHPDERVVAALRHTEVEVVAELGRIALPLAALTRLRPGDTLRLAVPVEGGTVDVRVEDQVLFRGRPTTSGSQLAVRVLSGDQAPSPSMPPAIITPAPASVKPARA